MLAIRALNDITNRASATPFVRKSVESRASFSPEDLSPFSNSPLASEPSILEECPQPVLRRNDPYNWKCLPEDETQAHQILRSRSLLRTVQLSTTVVPAPMIHIPTLSIPVPTISIDSPAAQLIQKTESPKPTSPIVVNPIVTASTSTPSASASRVLVQFKCHQAEYSCNIEVEKGQYIVVEGDRGIDIGVVNRINTDETKQYVERTGPVGQVMRFATQREVDYWAVQLKLDEDTAVEYCRQRVQRLHLPMDVRHAEYQFDKNKLTFYYDAKSRVDFVTLLKELYREFGCRIWMEKCRQ